MAKQRKHGTGSLRLRKDGRWEGRVVIGYDNKGLPKTKNVLAKTKAECEQKLKELRNTQQSQTTEAPKNNVTVGEWLDFWYQNYKKPLLRPNTQMSYERRIYQHIIPHLGTIFLRKLTTNDIQKFYLDLKEGGRLLRQKLYGEGLSDQTVHGIHITFRAALEQAVTEHLKAGTVSLGGKLAEQLSGKPVEIRFNKARTAIQIVCLPGHMKNGRLFFLKMGKRRSPQIISRQRPVKVLWRKPFRVLWLAIFAISRNYEAYTLSMTAAPLTQL